MPRRLILFVSALLGIAVSSLANGQQIIGKYGNWLTIVTVLPESHTRVCAMTYIFGAAGGHGIAKSVTFKIYARSERYPDGLSTMELFKESWDLAKDTRPDVVIKIDGQPGALGESIGHGNTIESRIPPEGLLQFFQALGNGRLLVVDFPSEHDADWNIVLIGAKQATASLLKCTGANRPSSPSSEFDCAQTVGLYAFTSRAQFMCNYSSYNERWIENAKKCSGELGDHDTKAAMTRGMQMFDENVAAHGLKYVCQDILKAFPDAVRK